MIHKSVSALLPPYRIGIDIGGTFTDVVVVDARGAVRTVKAPSDPADPTEGVLKAVATTAAVLAQTVEELLGKCSLLVHGSTIATNTLLERKGARVAMLTTAGFRDTLEIRRGLRLDPWDHRKPFPAPLVPRRLRFGITERIDASGTVVTPLDPASVEAAVEAAREQGVNAFAVCFLNSYVNPVHEEACRALIIRAAPHAWVSCSAAIAPIIGEYERGSTAVADAYVGPAIVPYLVALERNLRALGLTQPLLVVQSNGGVLNVEEIARQPVRMALSGPAAGVGALRFYGQDTGSENLVAIEVGGTSCDVTLMRSGSVAMTDQIDVDGICIATPSVEIYTVGAGGGTIGRVDSAGMMHAGPQGAGARPGPACYARGGRVPTVTDAHLVLGRLAPGDYADGTINLSLELAREAIDVGLARPLGISVEKASVGLLLLVEQNMIHAVERISVERGYDLKNFTLVAAGGAGPLHGASVSRQLGCAAVYVPRLAGVFCAFGMCNADIRLDRVRSWHGRLACDSEPVLATAFAGIEESASEGLTRQGFALDRVVFERSISMAYPGQQWPLETSCDAGLHPDLLRETFQAAHQLTFGHHQANAELEITHLRVAALGQLERLNAAVPEPSFAVSVPKSRRDVWFNADAAIADTPIYDGTGLRPGHHIAGPAIIDERTTTVMVGPGQQLSVTPANNFLITSARSVS